MDARDEKVAPGTLRALTERVSSVIMGKEEAVRMATAALVARGHLLIEDVPGVGKTTLAYTLAKAVNCSFNRIQFTSDMLPSDIIGVSIYNQDAREFEFKRGPIFANVVLADEINRTTPKTQSALLEAMNERRVSVDGVSHHLPDPFMVIATQNPIEYRGTYPLPESQMDRFAVHIKLGYPSEEHERRVVMELTELSAIEALSPVLDAADVLRIQQEASSVSVKETVVEYLLSIVRATRDHQEVMLGASTRGAQYLLKIAKALAYIDGRDYVLPSDVKEAAPHVLAHRIILKRRTYISDSVRLVNGITSEIAVPV